MSEHRDAPLAPCGRSFTGVVHSHLLGSLRLYLIDLEKSWSQKEAKRRTKEYQSLRDRQRRRPIGFLVDIYRTLFEKHPVFMPNDMRPDFKAYGLYPVLKQFILDPTQFGLIPYYAHFNMRQVTTLGPLLRGMHSPQSLVASAEYDSRQLVELCRCAKTFALTVLSYSKTSESYAQPERPKSALNEGVEREEVLAGEVLARMVVEYEPYMENLLEHLDYADIVIKTCSVTEGHDIWKLFNDRAVLGNIAMCPEEITLGIGGLAGHMSTSVASALQQFQNPTIPRDLIILARDKYGEKAVIDWVSQEIFIPIWEKMPSQFNNIFTYSRDSEVPGQKNLSDLKAASGGLLQPFRALSEQQNPTETKQAA